MIDLPREIIEEILLYLALPYTTLVCKYLHEIEESIISRRDTLICKRYHRLSNNILERMLVAEDFDSLIYYYIYMSTSIGKIISCY